MAALIRGNKKRRPIKISLNIPNHFMQLLTKMEIVSHEIANEEMKWLKNESIISPKK